MKCSFSQRLSEIMNIRKKKQSDVAYDTKIPKSAISQYISGKFEAKQDRLYILAKYFNVSEAWLMGYDVPMERTLKCSEGHDIPKTLYDISLSDHEKEVITAYRSAEKALQDGIDRMLGIEPLVTEQQAKKIG